MADRIRPLVGTAWRLTFGCLLLPWCLGTTWALFSVIRVAGSAAMFWVALAGGAASWTVVFLLLPKPIWVYVVGHELTHAVWAWLFGGKVKEFRATSTGGQVVVTKSNTLIILAPYFFPLYSVIWAAFWGLGSGLGHGERFLPWFHYGLGFTYAFHVTLTAHILRIRQPDIAAEGWFVSSIVIWLGNVLILLLTLPLLTSKVALGTALLWAFERTGRCLNWLTLPF